MREESGKRNLEITKKILSTIERISRVNLQLLIMEEKNKQTKCIGSLKKGKVLSDKVPPCLDLLAFRINFVR